MEKSANGKNEAPLPINNYQKNFSNPNGFALQNSKECGYDKANSGVSM